jgi:hypothetical protein
VEPGVVHHVLLSCKTSSERKEAKKLQLKKIQSHENVDETRPQDKRKGIVFKMRTGLIKAILALKH